MAFPIIPVVATLGTAGLAALIFGGKKEPQKMIEPPQEPKSGPVKQPETIPNPVKPSGLEIPKVIPRKTMPRVIPRRQPMPGPIPVPPNILPIPPAPAPLPIPSGTASGRVIAPSGLNLRDQPNTSGRPLTLMAFNSPVTILNPNAKLPATSGASHGWWKVRSANGIEGFASAEFIAIGNVAPQPLPVPPAPTPIIPPNILPPVPVPAGSLGKVTAKSGLNIRSAPNVASTILTLKPYGSIVTLAEPRIYPPTPGAPKGWYRLASSSGTDGYASAEFIEITNVAPPLPGPSPLPLPPAPPPTPVNMPNMGTVTASSGLNIRNQPNTTGTVLATMPKGSRLAINDPNNPSPPTAGAPKGWYRVTTSTGITGYGSVEWIQPDPSITGDIPPYGDSYYHVSQVAGEFDGKRSYSIRG